MYQATCPECRKAYRRGDLAEREDNDGPYLICTNFGFNPWGIIFGCGWVGNMEELMKEWAEIRRDEQKTDEHGDRCIT